MGPKVKLMPFPAPPTRNQQRPSLRVPKKGPIPPFKFNLNKLKNQHDSMASSSNIKKKPSLNKHKNNGPSPNTKSKPSHQNHGVNNLMKDAMVNIPNAIKSLPSFMQKLISNHASFVGSGRSFSDDFSLADISDYVYEDELEEAKEGDSKSSKQESEEENKKSN